MKRNLPSSGGRYKFGKRFKRKVQRKAERIVSWLPCNILQVASPPLPPAILSCSASLEILLHLPGIQTSSKNIESQLDWWWINFSYLSPLPRLLCILVQNLFKRINLLVELQAGIRKSNFNGLQTRPVIGSDLLTLQVRQVLPKGSACASILSRNLEKW